MYIWTKLWLDNRVDVDLNCKVVKLISATRGNLLTSQPLNEQCWGIDARDLQRETAVYIFLFFYVIQNTNVTYKASFATSREWKPLVGCVALSHLKTPGNFWEIRFFLLLQHISFCSTAAASIFQLETSPSVGSRDVMRVLQIYCF